MIIVSLPSNNKTYLRYKLKVTKYVLPGIMKYASEIQAHLKKGRYVTACLYGYLKLNSINIHN